jgi:hypothetical protein
VLSSGCVGVSSGYAYAPASDGYYYYDYYPAWNVYYYPQGRVYYWNDSGHWHSGSHLPHGYYLHAESREQLRLHTREPWREHHWEHGEFGPTGDREYRYQGYH